MVHGVGYSSRAPHGSRTQPEELARRRQLSPPRQRILHHTATPLRCERHSIDLDRQPAVQRVIRPVPGVGRRAGSCINRSCSGNDREGGHSRAGGKGDGAESELRSGRRELEAILDHRFYVRRSTLRRESPYRSLEE
jgi:hypothetical protein